jgi:2-dehydropantoate 2-reductase
MKIVILGAGALGSAIGAFLARAGEDVVIIARGERASLLRQRGVAVTGRENFTVPVPVAEDPQSLKDGDFLIVAVKGYDTEAALETVRHLSVDAALSVQNGVIKNERLAGCFGWQRTLGAVAAISAEVLSEGAVRLTLNDGIYLGEWPEGASSRVEALAATLTRAGIRGVVSFQIQAVEWSKYVSFAGAMAVAALARLETYKLLKDPDLAYLRVAIEREMALIAARLGIPLVDFGAARTKTLSTLPFEEAIVEIQKSGAAFEARGATAHKVSALQDLERARPIEVEDILGHALRKGVELGLSLPTVETCYRLLSGVNRALQ